MKNLIDELVEKHWREYEKDVIGAGFSCSNESLIKKEIDEFLEGIKGNYVYEKYTEDSDAYVKFIVRLEILRMIGKEISKFTSHEYPVPKRFHQAYSPRD